MRRGLGAAGVVKRREKDERMNELGTQIEENRAAKARELLETFKVKLTQFAEKHRSRIQKDPEFREQFVGMCESVGVDPMRSTKSFWSDVLLGMGSFYTDIAVQVLTIAVAQRTTSGPLLPMSKCMLLMQTKCSSKDIQRAVKGLTCFGHISVISVGDEDFICTFPSQQGTDPTEVLKAFTGKSGQTADAIAQKVAWDKNRVLHALQPLVKEGIMWIDDIESTRSYWLVTRWFET